MDRRWGCVGRFGSANRCPQPSIFRASSMAVSAREIKAPHPAQSPGVKPQHALFLPAARQQAGPISTKTILTGFRQITDELKTALPAFPPFLLHFPSFKLPVHYLEPTYLPPISSLQRFPPPSPQFGKRPSRADSPKSTISYSKLPPVFAPSKRSISIPGALLKPPPNVPLRGECSPRWPRPFSFRQFSGARFLYPGSTGSKSLPNRLNRDKTGFSGKPRRPQGRVRRFPVPGHGSSYPWSKY